jgi:hypothetical protein
MRALAQERNLKPPLDNAFELIPSKNDELLLQKSNTERQFAGLPVQAARGFCGAGKILADLQRFWAEAARKNLSFAPHGPRSRSRPRPRMLLRWANRFSTFFLSFIEISYCLILMMSRATWRASSYSSRVMDRKSMLEQQLALDGQA